MKILGIETSCDETAAAVVAGGTTVLSSVVSSQIDVHHLYGGVVPELASRKHIEAIVPVVLEAMEKSGVSLHELDAVAATQGPGLIGSLLVGYTFAKGYAYILGKPFIGINHLEGHVNSVFLEPDFPCFPFVALLVSGGHSSLYYVISHTEFECMGQTRDDAAGEAFDKVSKMLGLGYPGGGIIGKLAEKGDPGKIKFPRPLLPKSPNDFSFSGLKTAVNRYIHTHKDDYKDQIADIAAGFQESVVDVLSVKLIQAAREKNCNNIAIVGGVAANSRLREKVKQEAVINKMNIYIPSVKYCGDNAAMIALTGFYYLGKGITSDMNSDVYSRATRIICS